MVTGRRSPIGADGRGGVDQGGRSLPYPLSVGNPALAARRRRRSNNLLVALAFAAVFATGFLIPSIGPGFAFADIFIFGIIMVWIATIPEGQPKRVLPRVFIPLVLIFIGSLLGTLAVGIRPWIITDTVKDIGSFASFLAMVTILRMGGPRIRTAVGWASGLSTTLVTTLLLVELGTRKQATFANPNIAAHFLATNLVILTHVPLPRWMRYTAIVAAVVGLIETGSFGALLMTAGALSYLLFTMPRSKRRALIRRFAPLALVVLALGLASSSSEGLLSTSDKGFNQRHFERSSQGRLTRFAQAADVALENPLGLGPGSNRGLGLLPGDQEAHNEYLAYLTERGVIGLIGLLLLYVALFRLGKPGGLVRALVIGFALQSAVRETFHYRHLWLLLALALVLDEGLPDLEPNTPRLLSRPVR